MLLLSFISLLAAPFVISLSAIVSPMNKAIKIFYHYKEEKRS